MTCVGHLQLQYGLNQQTTSIHTIIQKIGMILHDICFLILADFFISQYHHKLLLVYIQ